MLGFPDCPVFYFSLPSLSGEPGARSTCPDVHFCSPIHLVAVLCKNSFFPPSPFRMSRFLDAGFGWAWLNAAVFEWRRGSWITKKVTQARLNFWRLVLFSFLSFVVGSGS